MTEEQPSSLTEGAGTGDVEDELPASSTAKSAEDRKAASALASLDASHDDAAAAAASSSKNVDREAVNQAMKRLGGAAAAAAAASSSPSSKAKTATALPAKNVKVDAADVALVIEQLELSRNKATELLKTHDGDAIKAMRAFVST